MNRLTSMKLLMTINICWSITIYQKLDIIESKQK